MSTTGIGWAGATHSATPAIRPGNAQYARQLGLTGVYTPQAVLNGKQEFVGSNRARLTSLLTDALHQPAASTIQLDGYAERAVGACRY